VRAAAERIETPETKMKADYDKLEQRYSDFKERMKKGGRTRKSKTLKSKRRKSKRRKSKRR